MPLGMVRALVAILVLTVFGCASQPYTTAPSTSEPQCRTLGASCKPADCNTPNPPPACANPPQTEPGPPCTECNCRVGLLCNENSPLPTVSPTCPSPTPCGIERADRETSNFVVIGDWGDNVCVPSCSSAVATMVNAWDAAYGIDFILTTGDNNYPGGYPHDLDTNLSLYAKWVPPKDPAPDYVPRFFPTLGNHDVYTACGQPYLDRFRHLAATSTSHKARYYNYLVPEPAGLIEIFSLNANNSEPDGLGMDCPQARWLRTALASSRARWKIVIFHEPPMATSVVDGFNTPLLWPFHEWGASVVLMGHKHYYERIETCGIPWIINGLGGTKGIDGLVGCTPVTGSKVRFNQSVGAMIGIANRERLKFCFIAATADNSYGACIDQFSID